MKRLLLFLIVGIASAKEVKEAPKLPDNIVRVYWRAISIYYSQNAAFQESLTIRQKQILDLIAQANTEISTQRVRLREVCGEDSDLNETGPEPLCVLKAKK